MKLFSNRPLSQETWYDSAAGSDSSPAVGARRFLRMLPLVLVPLAGSLLLTLFPGRPHEHSHVNLPLHAVLEAQGGLACVILALLMLLIGDSVDERRREFRLIIVSGLIFGGVLDTFHAMVPPGGTFVWMRTLSTFGGGLFFAGLLKPGSLRIPEKLPWMTLAASVVAGLGFLLFPGTVPEMLSEKEFTLMAKIMNPVGGLGYLIGAGAMLAREKLIGRLPALLVGTTVLFGTAGLLFSTSSPWAHDWWWWHIVRFVASLMLLGQAVLYARSLQRDILAERRMLEMSVAARTADLTSANAEMKRAMQDLKLNRHVLDKATIAIYLIDDDGRFAYVNECAAKYAGYTVEEMTGKPIGLMNPNISDAQWAARWEKVNARPPGERDVVTMIHHRKDGTTYPIEIFAHHLSHEGKTYRISMGIDITARLREEKAKHASPRWPNRRSNSPTPDTGVFPLTTRAIISAPLAPSKFSAIRRAPDTVIASPTGCRAWRRPTPPSPAPPASASPGPVPARFRSTTRFTLTNAPSTDASYGSALSAYSSATPISPMPRCTVSCRM